MRFDLLTTVVALTDKSEVPFLFASTWAPAEGISEGWLMSAFRQECRLKAGKDKLEVYYSRARIEGLVVGIITFCILALLVVPIYLLYRLTDGMDTPHSNAICLGILLLFILAFSAVLTLFTRARRHEILVSHVLKFVLGPELMIGCHLGCICCVSSPNPV